jgi:hypothetical protein
MARRALTLVAALIVAIVLVPLTPWRAGATPATVSGTVTSNSTWSGTVEVTADTTIASGVTVTVLPDTIVALDSGVNLSVAGSLRALGSTDSTFNQGLVAFEPAHAGQPWGQIIGLPGSSVFMMRTNLIGGGYFLTGSTDTGTAELECRSCALSLHSSIVNQGVLDGVRVLGGANAVIENTRVLEPNVTLRAGTTSGLTGSPTVLVENSVFQGAYFEANLGFSTVMDSALLLGGTQSPLSPGLTVAGEGAASLKLSGSDVRADVGINANAQWNATSDLVAGGLVWNTTAPAPSASQFSSMLTWQNLDLWSPSSREWWNGSSWSATLPAQLGGGAGTNPQFTGLSGGSFGLSNTSPVASLGLGTGGVPTTTQYTVPDAITVGVTPASPVVIGTPVTISAQMTLPGADVPQGTMTFYDAPVVQQNPTNVIGTAPIASDGTASLTTSALSIGAHHLRALGSSLTAPAYTAFDSSGAVPEYDAVAIPGGSVDDANLTFAAQAVSTTSAAQTVTLTSSGSMSLQISSVATTGDFSETNDCPATLTVGATCHVGVSFGPTAIGARNGTLVINDNSPDTPQTVTLSGTGIANTTTSVSASSASLSSRQPVTFTVNVGTTPTGLGTPDGQVDFADGSTPLGSATLNGGSASISTSTLSLGSHSITATYDGSTLFVGSTSSQLGVAVAKSPASLSTPAAVTGQYSDAVNVTSTLTDGQGAPIVGATVTFTLGSQSVTATTDANGVAAAPITLLSPAGTASVVASFAGDATDTAATSSPGSVTITKENATASYTGPTSVSTSSTTANVALTAAVSQANDGSLGDLSNATVVFKLYRSTNTSMTTPDITVGPVAVVPAVGGLTGTATASVSVAPATYTIVASVDPANGWFTAPDSVPATLKVAAQTVSSDAPVLLVGGGRFVSTSHAEGAIDMRANFEKRTTTPRGGMDLFVGNGKGLDEFVHATWNGGTLTFHGPEREATAVGHCSLQVFDHKTHRRMAVSSPLLVDTCQLDATDSGHGHRDTFSVAVTDANKRTVLQLGTTKSEVPLNFGDITIADSRVASQLGACTRYDRGDLRPAPFFARGDGRFERRNRW